MIKIPSEIACCEIVFTSPSLGWKFYELCEKRNA